MNHQWDWRTSSYSGGQGQCVEVRYGTGGTWIRDSVHPDDSALKFPSTEWRTFLRELAPE